MASGGGKRSTISCQDVEQPSLGLGRDTLATARARRQLKSGFGFVLESLTAIHRAGAGIILTYWAKDVARWLR